MVYMHKLPLPCSSLPVHLHKLAGDMAKGDDAVVYVIEAMMREDGTAPGSGRAWRFKANWAPGSAGAAAGGNFRSCAARCTIAIEL